MRRRATALAGLTAVVLAVAGCSDDGGGRALTPVAAATTEREAAAQPAVEPTTPTASPTATPTTAPPTTPPPAQPAYDVVAVQKQLIDLEYYGGPVDGKAGPALRAAVMAFQKVQGLPADGAVGKATLAALAAPKAPVLKASAPADRVEVDLTRQVLYVVKGGAVARVLPVSSGNGATYRQKDGSTARALTPVGWYKIERRILGERKADLGSLFDPQYFYKGWAIHGSNSVPAGPASHGCVRVTRWDAKWLLGQIGVGTSVYLYGGAHTFTAGSSAPGTDNPTGDTSAAAAPAAPAPAAPAPAPTTTTPSPEPSSPPPTTTTSPTPTASELPDGD